MIEEKDKQLSTHKQAKAQHKPKGIDVSFETTVHLKYSAFKNWKNKETGDLFAHTRNITYYLKMSWIDLGIGSGQKTHKLIQHTMDFPFISDIKDKDLTKNWRSESKLIQSICHTLFFLWNDLTTAYTALLLIEGLLLL